RRGVERALRMFDVARVLPEVRRADLGLFGIFGELHAGRERQRRRVAGAQRREVVVDQAVEQFARALGADRTRAGIGATFATGACAARARTHTSRAAFTARRGAALAAADRAHAAHPASARTRAARTGAARTAGAARAAGANR